MLGKQNFSVACVLAGAAQAAVLNDEHVAKYQNQLAHGNYYHTQMHPSFAAQRYISAQEDYHPGVKLNIDPAALLAAAKQQQSQ